MTVRVQFVGSGDSFGSGGRFQTCILVDGPGRRFTIDFGTSSLIALTQQVLDLIVTPYPARHTWQTHPTALRVDVAGTVVAYTGDGEWTAELARLGQGADLLIAESYFYSKPVKWHLNYPEFRAHKDDFGAKRIILTHMSREMLAHVQEVPEECAEDGLVVDVNP